MPHVSVTNHFPKLHLLEKYVVYIEINLEILAVYDVKESDIIELVSHMTLVKK